MGWYSRTEFPTANCDGYVFENETVRKAAIPDNEVLAHTVSDSPLCHISIGKWCRAAGVGIKDTSADGMRYKDDRCSKICADTAAKAAELINEYLDYNEIQPIYQMPSDTAECLRCHGSGDRFDQVGQMDCLGCHSPPDVVLVGTSHPGSKQKKGKF